MLFGWLADYSFPYGQSLELLLSCFRGSVSAKVNNLQKQLQRTELSSHLDESRQIQKLNNLESQAWLYEGILGRLGTDPSVNHERIARTIEGLEHKRGKILQELEPRRPFSYRILAGIQVSARILLASQAEKDYEKLQKIVTNLVVFTRAREPSQVILSEVIDKISIEIAQSVDQISPYRLRLAYGIDELMNALSAKLILNPNSLRTGNSYHSLVSELSSRNNLLAKQFNDLLVASQESNHEMARHTQEIFDLSRNISDLHRDISNRNADVYSLREHIKDLTASIQEKQSTINGLENSIDDLQTENQDLVDLSQENQERSAQLQTQLSHLNQEKENLQRKVRNLSAYIQGQESEIESFQEEEFRLNSLNADLQKRHQNLHQSYQNQQNEIASLKRKIDDLESLLKRYKAQSKKADSSQTTKASNKWIGTKLTISEKEFKSISNKSEYVYVKGHFRKGKWVNPHYRRRPK